MKLFTLLCITLWGVQSFTLRPASRGLLKVSTCLTNDCKSTHSSLSSLQMSSSPFKQGSSKLKTIVNRATNAFPIWVLSFSVLGAKFPSLFSWFIPYVTPALTLTMMSMGMTLTVADFKRVVKSWKYILVGFLAQYTIMPSAAFLLTRLLNLGPDLSAGLILVGCAPGGTASNLVSMIAKADLALSILMTTASTLAAVFMTPFLVTKLVGGMVSIKAADLVYSTLNVVLLPVLFGLIANVKFPKQCEAVSDYTPFMSVLLVATICGSISASNAGLLTGEAIGSVAGALKGVPLWKLLSAITALHSVGFGVGYFFSKLMGVDEKASRTVSIETGMQNSALSVVLAQHFPNPSLSALPGALSATCHSVLGSLLAAVWRKKTPTAVSSSYPMRKTYSIGNYRRGKP